MVKLFGYIYNILYMCVCVCVCTVFFRFFSILGYYKILDLEGNILSEISQIEEGKIFCDLTYIWNVKNPNP